MYGRFQAENFFVTMVASDCNLTPGVDGIIPLKDIPSTIEDLKLFYVVFKIDDPANRFTLPVYIEENQVKYKGYNVLQSHTLKKYDTAGLNDLAENFNYIFKNIDDIGTVIKKGDLDILVYGGEIVKGSVTVNIPDTTLTLTDNKTQHIVLDYMDSTIKVVDTIENISCYYFAEITTSGGKIDNIVPKKSLLSSQEVYSSDYFDRDPNTGALLIKDGAIGKTKIDFSNITTDDINQGRDQLLITPEEKEKIAEVDNKQDTIEDLEDIREGAALGATALQDADLADYEKKENRAETLENPDNNHYPTTKAVAEAIQDAGGGDMLRSTYDPNHVGGDAFDYNNLNNKPTIPAEQIQTDWNQNDSTKKDYLKNKPTIPAAQVQTDWNQNDSTKKDYLRNKPNIPDPQIQTDWNQNDNTKKDFLKNKPTIPTVNNNRITFSKNSSTINSITLNQSQDQTINFNINDVIKASTAPANPTQGTIWYDTANNLLKAYNGSVWKIVGEGDGDVQGPSSSTDGHLAVFDGGTGKLIKDGGNGVFSGDSGTNYYVKVGNNKPAVGTANNIMTVTLY